MMGSQITKDKALAMVEKGAKLIDVRSPIDFRDGTIPGAINIPTGRLSQIMGYDKKTKFILFDNENGVKLKNLELALSYTSQMYLNVYYFII